MCRRSLSLADPSSPVLFLSSSLTHPPSLPLILHPPSIPTAPPFSTSFPLIPFSFIHPHYAGYMLFWTVHTKTQTVKTVKSIFLHLTFIGKQQHCSSQPKSDEQWDNNSGYSVESLLFSFIYLHIFIITISVPDN